MEEYKYTANDSEDFDSKDFLTGIKVACLIIGVFVAIICCIAA